ncbi:MAG: hypothetical protein ACE148_00015 [Vicinamibacterales bacterium]
MSAAAGGDGSAAVSTIGALRAAGSRRGAWVREAAVVAAVAIALSILLTYPLAFKIDRVGRVLSGDGQFSIWNLSWVAHALLTHDRVFDANIFYPHRNTLAFSEANLVAGTMAVPGYWLTGNPYVAHNSVVLAGFTLSLACMYVLVRRLSGNVGAAAVAAVTYAFCPFVFARMAHIQLQMIFTLPLVMLATHHFVDRLTLAATLALAASLVVAALACGYYGIFAAVVTGFALAWFGLSRGLWQRARFWSLSAGAALLSMLSVYPFLARYTMLEGDGNEAFRSLQENARYSANWLAWVTAGGWGNRWMLERWGAGNEVLFPGFVALALGLAGIALGLAGARRRRGGLGAAKEAGDAEMVVDRRACRPEVIGFYALVGTAAFWLSFGPKAGLYILFYKYVPAATLLRAPARIGIVVTFALAVLGGLALSDLTSGRRKGWLFTTLFAALAAVELLQVPLHFPDAPPRVKAYEALARFPRGPVAEFPFFWLRQDFHRHSFYMLNSTWHWQPLLNGYSDHIPADFRQIASSLRAFPSLEGFDVLRERRVLYVVFHLNFYNSSNKRDLFDRLQRYAAHLRPIVRDREVWLYEIVSFPKQEWNAGASAPLTAPGIPGLEVFRAGP